ncbi:MAG: biopolymer transporter ExbD [Deltaproteobacteria bacterium]|nr:biopolymer transporter ExbD [Deltaproteobacteria bacterium]MBW1945363.1 biopolymer transporter ExbD [Deltaproteobacteria bacterium]MBW2206127.1 biopolymer transporter ExbD [Deltaproteobacteria bacterium]
MRFRKAKEEEPRLGLAPLIDIVFLLLIFFMVTSHFDVASGLHIQLPEVAQRLFNQKDNQLRLIIDKSGGMFLDGKRLDLKTLEKKLEKAVNEKDLVHLVLQADKDVRHGAVVQAMDVAKSVGINSIIIAAQWKADKVL